MALIFDKQIIIDAFKKGFLGKRLSDEEGKELLLYFKQKLKQVIGGKLKEGQVIQFKNQQYTIDFEGLQMELWQEFFGKEGWCIGNEIFINLPDEEIFKRADNRAYNWLRDLIPEKTAELTEENVQQYYMSGKTDEDFNVDDLDIGYEDAIPEGAKDFIDKNAVDISEILHQEDESIKQKREKVTDDLIGFVLDADRATIPNVDDFKKQMRDKYMNHPELLINQIRKRYKDYGELLVRWLVAIFPYRIEAFECLYKDQESFLKDIIMRYGESWSVPIAKEAVRAETVKRLNGLDGDERKAEVEKIKQFYKKYIPNLQNQNIESYYEPAIKKMKEIFKTGEPDRLLNNLLAILYESIAHQK